MPAVWAIVPAAGIGTRMRAERPKQYLPLAGKTVLEHTLERLLQAPRLVGLVVALHPEDNQFKQLAIASDRRIFCVTGGQERADSVRLALQFLASRVAPEDWALVHDAARPCVRVEQLNAFIDAALAAACGSILAAPVVDTLKRVDAHLHILATQERRDLWAAQTPQMFPYGQLLQALTSAAASGLSVTDEASAVEALGQPVRVVAGPSDNLKITRPDDLPLAELIIRAQIASKQACE